jgi:hypothetical protein
MYVNCGVIVYTRLIKLSATQGMRDDNYVFNSINIFKQRVHPRF